MKKGNHLLIALLLISLLLSGCGTAPERAEVPDAVPSSVPTSTPSAAPVETPVPAEASLPPLTPAEPAEWVIYWYLCGSNLESFYGCASNDLAEAMAVDLPEGVRVVIETGGSYEWHNDNVSAGKLQRFVLDSKGFYKVDEQPDADMGNSETLASFLSFCEKYYPGQHSMILFWNHGGGSVAGAAFDEVYGYDSLTLTEFRQAFEQVYPLSGTPPFDIVGFDTCLMSTVDVAAAFRNVADYLVASEELEPGCGWYYTGWLGTLAKNTGIAPLDLAKSICDTYAMECKKQNSHYEITLSVTDLNKIGALIDTYNALGNEALLSALENPEFFASLGREARQTENYGGNTREQGFTNMVDLGHLVQNCAELFPGTANSVLNALKNCVVYKINGPYRAKATGLSCYYSFDADIKDFASYTTIGSSEAFKYLYAYGLTGQLSNAGMDYVAALGNKTAPKQESLSSYIPDHVPSYSLHPLTVQALPEPETPAASAPEAAISPAAVQTLSDSVGSMGTVQPALQNASTTGNTVSNGVLPTANLNIPWGNNGNDPGNSNDNEPGNADNDDRDNKWNQELLDAIAASRAEQKRLEAERQAAEEAERQATEEAARQAAEEAARQAAEEAERQEMLRQIREWQAQQAAANANNGSLPHVPTLDDFDLSKSVRVYVDSNGFPTMELDPDLSNALSLVRVRIRQAVADNSGRTDLVDWGENELINTDWQNGKVQAWFSGYWAALDNTALMTELCYSSDDYTLFSAPVLLNGEVCNLHIAYIKHITKLSGGGTQTDYDWHILGARKGLDPCGMADKYLFQLKPGDRIIPLYYVMQNAGSPDSEWQYYYQEENAIIYEDESQLDMMEDFGPAVYELCFELVDSRGQTALSDSFYVKVSEDLVFTQLWKDFSAGRTTGLERFR